MSPSGSQSSSPLSSASSSHSMLSSPLPPSSSASSLFFGGKAATVPTVKVTRVVRQAVRKPTAPAPSILPAPKPKPRAKPRTDTAEEPRTNAKKRRSTSPPLSSEPSKKAPRLHASSSSRASSSTSRPKRTAKQRALEQKHVFDDVADSLPEPIYRQGVRQSRSASSVNQTFEIEPIPRHVSIDEKFNPFPELPAPRLKTAYDVVKDLGTRYYEAYFKNPDDPSDTSFEVVDGKYPRKELEYPNSDSHDYYALVAPKDPDHYNPIMCLESSLHTICREYLNPEQQALLGWSDDDLYLNDGTPSRPSRSRQHSSPPPSRDSSTSPPPTSSRFSSIPASLPASSKPPSSNVSVSSLSSLSSPEPEPAPLSAAATTTQDPPLSATDEPPRSSSREDQPNLLRQLKRAINSRNGPLFLSTLSAINAYLFSFKYSGKVDSDSDTFSPSPTPPPPRTALAVKTKEWDGHGIPMTVTTRILEEAYQRAVGPRIKELRKYETWTSEVYGELTPRFVSEIIRVSGLGPGMQFMDLGSGVGNVVLQAALESGCEAYGIEINPAPAEIAKGFKEQFEMRCKMWGLRAGSIELEEGSMLESRRVDELLPKADVVLVNNKVFLESLNESLRPKFLDLKENAILISLKPFSAPSARLTARNVDDMSAIFDVSERRYHSGHVSWGSGGGTYYVHRVDRTGYAVDKERFERQNPRRARSVKYTPSHYDD